jgi:hypothetical protein
MTHDRVKAGDGGYDARATVPVAERCAYYGPRSQCGRPAAKPEPRIPKLVPHGLSPPRLRVSLVRGGVLSHDLGHVRAEPAGCGQVDGQEAFLAGEPELFVEAADAEEGDAPNDGATSDEAEDRRAWKCPVGRQRALGHQLTDRVEPPRIPDKDSRRKQSESRIRREKLGSASKSTWLPPRVVVTERDVAGRCRFDADVPGGGPSIVLESQKPNVRERGSDGRSRSVRGRVVDDDDLGVLRKSHEPFERTQERCPAIPRRDDDGDLTLTAHVQDDVGIAPLGIVKPAGSGTSRSCAQSRTMG